MINKLIKLLIIITIVSIQMSVMPVTFPEEMIPNLGLVLLFVWLLANGFNKMLPWIIVTGFVFDLVFFYPIGVNIIFFLIICYIISFTTQRFLVEHKFWSFVFVYLISLFISFSVYYFNKIYIYMDGWDFLSTLFQKQDIKNIFILSILNLFLYYIMLVIIRPIEKHLSMYESKIKLK